MRSRGNLPPILFLLAGLTWGLALGGWAQPALGLARALTADSREGATAAPTVAERRGAIGAQAITPARISYQGRLADPATGAPVPDGTFSLTFRLFDEASGGTLLETLSGLDVTTRGGLFTTSLGFSQAHFNGQDLYLEIQVETETLSPRQQLTAAPYALGLVPGAALTAELPGALVSLTNTSPSGPGLLGMHGASTGAEPGVRGETSSTDNFAAGVLGRVTSTTPGVSSAGVRGISEGTGQDGIGVWGSQEGNGTGVYGQTASGTGVFGDSRFGRGVSGLSEFGDGVIGSSSGGAGVAGSSSSGTGVSGVSLSGTGVSGVNTTGNTPAVEGQTNSAADFAVGVRGRVNSGAPGANSAGVWGSNASRTERGIGVWGQHFGGGLGVLGQSPSGMGVRGESDSGVGVFGRSPTGLAGRFEGNVTVTGSVSKGGGSFRIDHPLDPANKYLSHSFVESPEMLNVYNGNVTLDASGKAWVGLPEWFEALNREFRYQLTAIGAPGPELHVAQEIAGNRFQIAGGSPGGKVSWLVTGVRQDAWASAHRVQVEEEKTAVERGYYLHPELYGQPESRSVAWAQYPEQMQDTPAGREKSDTPKR